MTDKIRVVVVDDMDETREHLSKLLSFETDVEVVGSAASGVETLDMASALQPEVLLLDINTKVQLLLNPSDSGSDGRTVVLTLNRGVPFVAGSQQTPVSKDIVRLAQAVRGDEPSTVTIAEEARPSSRHSLFAWR